MAKKNTSHESEGGFSALLRFLRKILPIAQPPLPDIRERDINLTALEKTLLKYLFRNYEFIVINREFGEGKSPSRVFQVSPWREGRKRADLAVKLGPQHLIESEIDRQEQYIQDMLPFSAAPLTVPPIYKNELGAVAYTYVGEGELGQTLSLKDYYLEHSADDVLKVLERLLIRTLGQAYYRFRHPGQRPFLFEDIYGPFFLPDSTLSSIVNHIFAGVADVNLQAETIHLAGHTYPNPLYFYKTYLNQSLPPNLSINHGDLHMYNVLVDIDGKPWLIDPGRATEGHTLFDFIELETHLRHAILGEMDFDLADLISFERNLICAATEQPYTPPAHQDLAKAFEIIHGIRSFARGYLAQDHTFQTEYVPAQFLYTLSTLRYHKWNGARSARHAFVTATLLAAYLQEQFDCQAPLHLTDPAIEQHVYYLKKTDGDEEAQQAERQQTFINQLQQAADRLNEWLDRPPGPVTWDPGPRPERHTMTRRYFSGKWEKESGQARAWLMAYEMNDTYLLRLVIIYPGQTHPPEIFAEMRHQLPWQPDTILPEWLGQSFFYTGISQANPTHLGQATFETSSLRHTSLTCGELYGQADHEPDSESAYLLVCTSPEQDDLAGDFFDRLAAQLGWYAHKAYRQKEEYESYLRSQANDLERSLSTLLSKANALNDRLSRGEKDFETLSDFHAQVRELEIAIPHYDGLLTKIKNILTVIKINVENYRWLTESNDYLNEPEQDEIFVKELRHLEPLPRQVEIDLDLWQHTLDQARRTLETLRSVAERFPLANHDPTQIAAAIQEQVQSERSLFEHFEVNLTIMFDDIKDSTTYVAQHGDRQWQRLMQQHNDLLHPIIARHQGQMVKNLGDGSLTIFADAAVAVQAALEIRRELLRHNHTAPPENKLPIRIGLHSGRALLSDADVLGLAVSLAARVCAEADAGEVVISEATYQQAGEVAAGFESLGLRTLKGVEGEMGLYRGVVQG